MRKGHATVDSSTFQTILQSSMDGFWLVDLEGRLLEVNGTYERMSGYTREELLSMTVSDLEDAESAALVALHMRRIHETGEDRFETRHRRKDGVTFEVENSVKYLPLDGGRFSVFLRDVTERKKIEAELLKTSRLLKAMINAVPDLVWFKDSDGVFQALNHKVELLFGRPAEEILGKTDYDLWSEDRADKESVINQGAISAGTVTMTEEEFSFVGDGHREIVETAKTPVYGEDGSLMGLLGIARDITQRKLSETTLRKPTAELRTLLDALPVQVWMKDVEGVFRLCNKLFAEFYGRTEEEILGMTDYDLSERRLADIYVQGDRNAIAHGKPLTTEDEVVFVDGHRETLETTKAAVHDDSGRLLGVIGIGKNISERRAAEAERARFLTELQQSQKMESLGTLAGGIAHDINNVLAVILSVASVGTLKNPPGSENFKAFNTIGRATERGSKLVKNILTFARKSPRLTDAVDLHGLLRDEVLLLERTTETRIRFALELDSEPALIPGDSDALGVVLMNLCVNAVQAIAGTGTVTLRTRVSDQRVEVSVIDSGVGMSKEVLERALDPFFTTKPTGQGTGLGLPMVYATVKAHGGSMELTSEPGRGTTVKLSFARARRSETAPPGESLMELTEIPNLHVLVIDDDELVRTTLGESLEALGHRATLAESGEQAYAFLEAGFEPDLAILDLNMPGWGGPATLERIREQRPTLPVIVSTGRLDQTAVELETTTPGVTLMGKPYALLELRRQLQLSLRPPQVP